MEKGIITRAGAFYSLYDQKVQGKNALSELLKKDEKLREKLKKDVVNLIKNKHKDDTKD
jgi:hypothetical protein